MASKLYTAGGVTYGGMRAKVQSAWEWIKPPQPRGAPKVQTGGRLMFRLPRDDTALDIWRKCADEARKGELGLMLGKPNDQELGKSTVPMLVYVKDVYDAAEVFRVAQRVAQLGGPRTHVLKDADGKLVGDNGSPSPSPKRARHDEGEAPLPTAGVKELDDPDAINWSALMGGASAKPTLPATAKGVIVQDDASVNWAALLGKPSAKAEMAQGSTVAADTLPEHQGVTMESVLALRSDKEPEARANGFPVRGAGEPDMTASAFYERFVARTAAECAAELAAPQKSQAWLRARSLSITASDFGAAVGHNAYSSPDDVLEKKLWDSFVGNDATAWGSHCEDMAAAAFLAWAKRENPDAKVMLHHENLMKSASTPWMAVSPDGFLERTDASGKRTMELVEFKCPTRESRGGLNVHPYAHYPGNIPPYYADQVQGISGYLNTNLGGYRGLPLTGIYFVVWRPKRLWVTRVPVDAAYYNGTLLPSLKTFFFGRMLPAFAHKYNGRLRNGDIVPVEKI